MFLTISVVSSIAFVFQPPTISASSLLPGSLFLVLATCIYALLREQAKTISHATNLSPIQHSVLRPLAIRVFALWTLYLAISAPQSPKLYPWPFIAGLLRLVQFYTMVILVRHKYTDQQTQIAKIFRPSMGPVWLRLL
jgi:cytochrome bd-type quinol oxidase subunit 2